MLKEKKTYPMFIWGARSAIQKAIRRSDGPMLMRAFDALWHEDSAMRNWLLWRLPVLAAEEIWQFIDLVQAEIDAAKTLMKEGKKEEAYRAIGVTLQALCVGTKDKAAWGLTAMLSAQEKGLPLPKMNDLQMRQWKSILAADQCYFRSGRHVELWELLFRKAAANGNERIVKIVEAAHNRYVAGGMEFDKKLMMSTAILAMTEETLQVPGGQAETDLDSQMSGDWPWYVYDMHTKIGKRALTYVANNIGIEASLLFDVWFMCESNRIAQRKDTDFWYDWYQDRYLEKCGLTYATWQTCEARQALKQMIEIFRDEEQERAAA